MSAVSHSLALPDERTVSVLFRSGRMADARRRTSDAALHDLALDQVLDRLAEQAPAAADAFRTLCADEAEVTYRQDVFSALADDGLREAVADFLTAMGHVDAAEQAAQHPHYPYEGELWSLEAVLRYVAAVEALAEAVKASPATEACEAFSRLGAFLSGYLHSDDFLHTSQQAQECRAEMDGLDYTMLIRGGRVVVAPSDDEDDLRAQVMDTFARFRADGPTVDVETFHDTGIDHVQARVLEKVALVHPIPFAHLRRFATAADAFRDETVTRFAEEVLFYVAWLDHTAPLRRAGLPLCLPEVSARSKELAAQETFDVSLATRLVEKGVPVVLNDISLSGPERIIVVSGPNQGGKSTTARTVGQLHHVAGIGCPVPGRAVRIFLCDQVLTAFEREESLEDREGRLGAEIHRMHDLLATATERSVLVLNEVFSSTALHDARILTRDVLERILALGALAVCVTFIDELSRLDDRTVSMVSTVDRDNPAVRTFRVERRTADGRAYARALAAVHGLTAEQITTRVNRRTEDER